MPINDHERVSPTSLVLLQPIIAALGGDAVPRPTAALPLPCLWLERSRTIACATPVQAPALFQAEMVLAAAVDRVDVLLVRHGLHPETLDDVTIDVALGRDRAPAMLWSMVAWRGTGASLWLVPPLLGRGTSVRIDAAGLTLSAAPPYADADERSDGVGRAARETVLALRRRRRP